MARILVVDDNYSIRATLDYLLRAAGHQIVLAESGTAALRKAAEGGIELVLADINMPEMDGVELCRAIRQDPGLRTVPVLLMTGCPDSAAAGQAESAGARAVLSKPFVIEELVSTVRNNLPAGPNAGIKAPVPAPGKCAG